MIELEDFGDEDFDHLISWVESKDLMIQFAGSIFTYPLTRMQLEKYLSDDKRKVFKVIDSDTKRSIGHTEIYRPDANVSRLCRILIGNKDYRGKGVGEELIRVLVDHSSSNYNAEIVELNVFEWNISAIKCYEKVGFKINPNKISTIEFNNKAWRVLNMNFTKKG